MILNDDVGDARREENWVFFEDATDPFRKVDEFDIFQPSLGGLHEHTESTKLCNFRRVYFKEFMVSEIAKGEAGKQTVFGSCQRQLQRRESFDVFDCSDAARDAMQQYRNTWRYLETLTDSAVGAEHQETFQQFVSFFSSSSLPWFHHFVRVFV